MHSPFRAESLFLPATQTQSLGERIEALHRQVRRIAPTVTRLACALYEPTEDLLKTFVNSTVDGPALNAYQVRLADSPSLKALADTQRCRVIPDLQQAEIGRAHV